MSAIKVVKPDDIAAFVFGDRFLVILEDNESFGDESVKKSIAAEADQNCPTLPSLPSVPFPVRDASNFRRILGQYFSGRYEILSGLQIHKFRENMRSIPWDAEGQRRVVAHFVFNDIYVALPGGKMEMVFVKEPSIIFCLPSNPSIIVSPAITNQECTIVTIFTRAKG